VCRGWPLDAFQSIEAVFWGGMPISQVSVDGNIGSPKVEEYARAQRDIVKVYVNVLGRYPDPAAMKELVRMRMMRRRRLMKKSCYQVLSNIYL
jgi:hypothetical protein